MDTREPLDSDLELKFFGVQGNNSESHTNAWFRPTVGTITFIDMSNRNSFKAFNLLSAMRSEINNVSLCITHTHPDHISGIADLAFAAHDLTGEKLNVYTIDSLKNDVCEAFRLFGAGYSTGSGNELFSVCRLTEYAPNWMQSFIPTTHSKDIRGACGFRFEVKNKIIVYSGDTNSFEPFEEEVLRITRHYEQLKTKPKTIELYLDIATAPKRGLHINWQPGDDFEQHLSHLLKRSPRLKVIFMHYNNAPELAKRIEESSLTQGAKSRLFIAKET